MDQSTHGESSQASPSAGNAASAKGRSAQCTAHASDADIPARSNAAVVFRLCCSMSCSFVGTALPRRLSRFCSILPCSRQGQGGTCPGLSGVVSQKFGDDQFITCHQVYHMLCYSRVKVRLPSVYFQRIPFRRAPNTPKPFTIKLLRTLLHFLHQEKT